MEVAARKPSTQVLAVPEQESVPSQAQVSLEEDLRIYASDIAEQATARLEAQRKVEMIRQVLADIELEVLILSSVQELSVREIGHIVHRSEQAVHSLLHRARQKARERLEQDA